MKAHGAARQGEEKASLGRIHPADRRSGLGGSSASW
jgi:hypothetical protein